VLFVPVLCVMPTEDNKYVIHGPAPLQPLPKLSLGKLIYDSLLTNPNKHAALVSISTFDIITHFTINIIYRQALKIVAQIFKINIEIKINFKSVKNAKIMGMFCISHLEISNVCLTRIKGCCGEFLKLTLGENN
jgi:hypothetical protein